ELIDEAHEHRRVGLRPGRAEEDLVGLGIFDRLDYRARRQHAHAGLAHDAADPREFHRIEARLRFLAVEERRRRHAAVDQTEDRAVTRRRIIDVVAGADAAAANHVLHDNSRIARQILAHVARDQAAILIVAAAD